MRESECLLLVVEQLVFLVEVVNGSEFLKEQLVFARFQKHISGNSIVSDCFVWVKVLDDLEHCFCSEVEIRDVKWVLILMDLF